VSREWNAATYHRVSAPQVSWGKKVLARVQLRGDEYLLDAGCGTGRLTEDLLQALPNGRVTAIDLSQNMLRAAREHLQPRFGAHVTFVAADLQSLPFTNAVDGIFSTAAFHWIRDHDRLFRSLHRALRPGGWLIAQCGGGPNLAHLRNRLRDLVNTTLYAPFLARFEEPWLFENAESAAVRLRNAGFTEIETSIEAAPTVLGGESEFREFVSHVILHRHLERLPNDKVRTELLNRLTSLAAADDPPYSLDYWRLNLKGRA
jgi:trans-aconitate 2-methyltransferase